MYLAGRGMCPQNDAGRGGMERVPHIARRVMLRNIEQLEVCFVVFDFACPKNLKTHVRPDVVNVAQHLSRRVQPAACDRTTGQGHIDLARFKVMRQFALADQVCTDDQRRFQRIFDFISSLAERCPVFFR